MIENPVRHPIVVRGVDDEVVVYPVIPLTAGTGIPPWS